MEENSCKAVRLNLWEYAAKVLPALESEAIGAHLDACRECNRFLADTSSLRKGFRHLEAQAVPPLLQTRLQVIASRERSRQFLRLDPTAWLRDKLADAMLAFDNFLKPYAVPATGGLLASCLCFSLIAHTLQLRPGLQFPNDEMPIGLFTEVAIDDVSPFTLPGKDVTVELTVNAKGQVTDFTPIPQPGAPAPSADEMNQIASFVLYSTFTPATRFGQPVASKRLFAIRHFLCTQDGDERMRERNGRTGLTSVKPKLGQHFLSSSRILERIADAACPPETEQAIEIGPGHGALTEYLLARVQRMVAIETDRELAAELHDRYCARSSPPVGPLLQIVEGDALHVDWNQWGPGVLAGNLPYYVATAIISKYLNNAGPLRQAVFLIQKEVAERVTAKPGTRDFGYLSVECQYLAKAEYLFSVPPGAFRPPPKVDSAVIRLIPRVAVASEEDKAFLGFASVCFRQKRKTLRNNLAAVYPREKLEGLSKRAEQLSVAELVELFHSLRGTPAGTPIC